MEAAGLCFNVAKDASVSFYRPWKDYKRGFGGLNGNFWLGNDWINWLTSLGPTELRVDLGPSRSTFAEYSRFSVANEGDQHRLSVSGYRGNAGEKMIETHNGRRFTAYDRGNDDYGANCAHTYQSAWWFGACASAHLNGVFGTNQAWAGIYWHPKKWGFSEMKLRLV